MKYPYIFINKKDIEALQNLLAPLGYNKQSIGKYLVKYPYVVLDSHDTGGLDFYNTITSPRYHELSILKFIRIAANIKKVAPSINTRIYLLKL